MAECLADSIGVLEAHHLAARFDDEAPPVWALVDRELTVRIIKNLIRNCVQHADGDIEVRILASEAAVILFRNPVRNAPAIDVDQLFDPFYSVDRGRGKSTGLGLSIVGLLAEQMGGCTGAALQDGLLDIRVMLPLSV